MADPAPPALQGIRVVERTTGAAGQIAGMLLADLGADVVRVGRSSSVEPADLPGWLCWNRGKRIVDVEDDAALERLLLRADVLVLDATPTERAGARLDADSLRLRAPALVDVWMPPIGTSGRWSELPHDQLLLDAIGGFAAHHPATEERPVAAVVPGRHAAQGALGAVAALSGLIGRIRDGWGRSATVTGLHAEAAILNTVMARSADGLPMLSVGKLLPGPPSYRLYAGADGRWLFLAALTPELFIKALDVLDRMDVLVHPDVGGDFLNILQPDVGAMVGAELEATFATSSTDDWLERFAAADVPAAPVGDPAGWLQGDVLGYACPPVTHERRDLGPVVMPGLPVTLAANPGVPGAPPEQATGEPSGEVWVDVADLPRPTGDAPGADDRPLSGLRVVDFSTFLAAPFVGTLMALHGADVVKVEAPTGDPYAVYSAPYALINEHKPRMTADLASDEGRATLLELAGVADVVVDNLVASSLARRKLTPDRFEAANPVLVRCSVTAYGAEGPFAEHPGFDPIMQSVSGLASVQGGDGRPVASTAPMLDIAAGCVGALGTLAALWARHQSGQGQRVFTSLAAVSAFVQSAELTTYDGRPPRPVGGPDFAGPSLWRRLYKAADRWFAVAAATDEQRDAFLDVVGQSGPPATEDDAQIDTISRTIEQRPCDEWLDLLDAAGVPACAAINRFEMDHPFLVEHRYSHIVDTPHVGRLEIVGGYTDWHHIDRLPPLPVDELRADVAAVLARWSTDAKA